MKPCLLRFGLIIALLAGITATPALSYARIPQLDTNAEAAAVVDVSSGRILYSKQGDVRMRIASLTKVMTAIVAIEQGNLADLVTVSRNAAVQEGSSVYLKAGEQVSLSTLLYGLMLRSGNDAAVAIAEHVGGSLEGFVYMMNEKAAQLGMTNTHFTNPSGLDEEGHVSTANDLAKLTAYALKNPVFRDIVKTKVKRLPNPDGRWDYVWENKNKMLHLYEGADGVKTGYTKLARRCLISSATRGGQQIAVVTLNDNYDWADHARALDYGFEHFPLTQLAKKGEPVDGTKLVIGSNFYYPLTEEEKSRVTKKTILGDPRSLSYRLGELGRLQISLENEVIASLPLYDGQHPIFRRDENGASEKSAGTWSKEGGYMEKLQRLVRALFSFVREPAGKERA